ncbi:MAG: vWA domain-containing protein [Planctomycetota bacterium]
MKSSVDETPANANVLPPPEPLPDLEPPVIQPLEETLEETVVDEDEVSVEDLSVGPAQDILGLGGSSGGGRGGGGRRSGLAASALVPLEGVGTGSPFQAYVAELRARGLDVAFVIDATASMDKYISSARLAIDDIIADLSAVVPDLRLGIVAYRDRSDDWLTRKVDLTDDRYLVHNFLGDLEAAGGGDFEEAVEEGLRVAAESLSWRVASRRVIILVGDAPPHKEHEGAALNVARSFNRADDAAISVLFTNANETGEPTEHETQARTVLERIARTGGGRLEDLGVTGELLRDRILDASFGSVWREEIQGLLGLSTQESLRRRIVAARVRTRDVKWLVAALATPPVHPALVDGCLLLFDPAIAKRAFDLFVDESVAQPVRSAALYILKRKLAPGLALDVTLPLAEQSAALSKLRREVERVRPAIAPAAEPRNAAPPAPPPAPPPGAAFGRRPQQGSTFYECGVDGC